MARLQVMLSDEGGGACGERGARFGDDGSCVVLEGPVATDELVLFEAGFRALAARGAGGSAKEKEGGGDKLTENNSLWFRQLLCT